MLDLLFHEAPETGRAPIELTKLAKKKPVREIELHP